MLKYYFLTDKISTRGYMKRLLSFLFTSFLVITAVFAAEPGDEYDDGYIYEQNGAGDQFLKFDFFLFQKHIPSEYYSFM